MEQFKESLYHKIEQIILDAVEDSKQLNTAQALSAIEEVLIMCAASVMDGQNKSSRSMDIPNNRVAALQIIPAALFKSFLNEIDEYILQSKLEKESAH